ncbi:TetR/AcrR family transcriptional regulator [Kribbella qitaiheensis]|uniref:TetR/AcrR family transcriptional regulator n=1 Tax=Kribbella qitaiheensis TaxID=1544730 RepID=A0A7G6WXN9_9ACTN|nr:TetR family transcriptional regulator [Kribbella qitaiheensis]QNE18754.1 TetR/AcrR family transcriptional regulator [Kribbella qitaiheensis]
MQRNADRTKARILEAATEEFAALGIAGARVNRIAEVAGCNKAMLYAYYGNKDGLFDAVFTASVEAYLEAVNFDAYDLPRYAGRVFDFFEEHPEHLRLAVWYRLERPGSARLEAVLDVNANRLAELEKARRAGAFHSDFRLAELLSLVQAIATNWSSMTPEFTATAPVSRARRRRAVVTAVAKLLDQ